MDAAASMRYGYAVLGLGFFVLIVAILFIAPDETAPHPTMLISANTSPRCTDGILTVPALALEGIPPGTQTLVVIAGNVVRYGLPPSTDAIPGGEWGACADAAVPDVTLYATDITLNFIQAPTKDDVLAAIDGHVLETAKLTGVYDRSATQ